MDAKILYFNQAEQLKCCLPIAIDPKIESSRFFDSILDNFNGKEIAFSEFYVWINNKKNGAIYQELI